MGALDGRVAIITGGAGSLGAATARLFLDEGARVMLVDLRDEDLARTAAKLNSQNLATCRADVTKGADAAAYVKATVDRFGAVDILFSNAGNFGVVAPIEEYPEDVFDSVIAVHVRGALLAAKHTVPVMKKGGAIIITSSVAAVRGDPGVYAYITAKHAQIGLLRCLSKELAPRGIRVNTIHPGPIDNQFQLNVEKGLGEVIGGDGTEFFNSIIPMHRHAAPEEIARSVLYLASDQASFTTGAMLMVDGGMSA